MTMEIYLAWIEMWFTSIKKWLTSSETVARQGCLFGAGGDLCAQPVRPTPGITTNANASGGYKNQQ